MAHSGQGFPTPPATSAASGSRYDKRRRIQDSSVVGSDVTTSSTSSGGSSWSAERFRVGIPGLQLLPLLSIDPPGNSPALLKFRELLPTIHQILQTRGVVFVPNRTTLVHRTLPGSSPTADDLTILISANWRNDDEEGDVWFRAANDIRELLVQSSAHTRSIKVELLSWQLMKEKYIGIVEREHPLVAAWSTINPRIHQVIDGSTALKRDWISIDALRIGYISEASYPTPVTILVTVDWGLDRRQWVADERRIKQLLLEHGLKDVEVLFERGELNPEAFINHPPNRAPYDTYEYYTGDYPLQATMGIDFGPEKDFALPGGDVILGPTGTIGGYIDLIHPNGSTKKLAVTNYHCVRWGLPGFAFCKNVLDEVVEAAVPKKSAIQKADEEGLSLGSETGKSMYFESPSRHKHKFSLANHERQIQDKIRPSQIKSQAQQQSDRQRAKEFEAARDRKQKYFDQGKHKLGYVFLASGYKQRSKMNSAIDLALLTLNTQKVGSNRIPDASFWASKGLDVPEQAGKLLNDTVSCAECEGLDQVFKYGATTGATVGRFNSIRSDVHPPMWDGVEMPYATEYCFVADPNPNNKFAGRGDSGSFIFTSHGQWVGLLWGGKTISNGIYAPVSYITDARDILDYLGNIRIKEGRFKARLSKD